MKKIISFFICFLLLLQVSGCNFSTAKKKTDLAKTFTGGKTAIDALWVQTLPNGAKGGTSRVTVSVEKNPSKKLRIGFYEEEVAGTGAMWRSAGWMSAVFATFLLGENLADYRFTYDIGGRIDGPSAGALMTVAVLSILRGDSIKKDATMTGTINPDGTIGPVGGIPHKITGAKKAKKKLILVPAGQRYSMDLNENKSVDVVALGRREGVTVKEVGNIYEAYKLLTGKPLPQPYKNADDPQLSEKNFDKMKSKAKSWYARYLEEKAKYDSLNPALKIAELEQIMTQANEAAAQSDKYLGEGLAASAYGQAQKAVVFATIAQLSGKTLETLVSSGFDAAAKSAGGGISQVKIDALLDTLQSEERDTLGGLVATIDAYGSLSIAMGLQSRAEEALARQSQTVEEEAGKITEATLYTALAATMAEAAEDRLAFGGGGKKTKLKTANIKQEAEAFRRAAEANLNYFDNVYLGEVSKNTGMSLDAAKMNFQQNDMDYAFAVSSLNALPSLKKSLGAGRDYQMAVLGNSMVSYNLTAGLIARYYSLGVQSENGQAASVANEKAMINMLDSSEDQARESIAAAAKAGADPSLQTAYFEEGKTLREGKLDEKLEALSDLWMAFLESKLTANLSH